jgi:hypothetical protein
MLERIAVEFFIADGEVKDSGSPDQMAVRSY